MITLYESLPRLPAAGRPVAGGHVLGVRGVFGGLAVLAVGARCRYISANFPK